MRTTAFHRHESASSVRSTDQPPGNHCDIFSQLSDKTRHNVAYPRIGYVENQQKDKRAKDAGARSITLPVRRQKTQIKKTASPALSARLQRLSRPRRRHETRSFFQLLPVPDMQLLVLSFLRPIQDLVVTMTVCKAWRTLCQADELWASLIPSATRIINATNSDQLLSRPKHITEQNQNRNSGSHFLALRKKAEHRAESKLSRARKVLKTATARSAETNLETTARWLELEVSTCINGTACALLPFRRKNQRSSKGNFAVHAPSPAPNVQDGVLKFNSTLCLKLEVPVDFDFESLENIQIFCRSKKLGQRRPTLVFNAGREDNRKTSSVVKGSQDGGGGRGGGGKVRDGELEFVEWLSGDFRKSRSSAVFGTRLCAGPQCNSLREEESNQRPRRGVRAPCTPRPQLETVVVSVHLADVLDAFRILDHRCAIYDDLDSKYGLHDMRCSITIRSFGVCWWEQTFRCLTARDCDRSDNDNNSKFSSFGGGRNCSKSKHAKKQFVFDLLTPEGCVRDVTRQIGIKGRDGNMLTVPELYIRSTTIADVVKRFAIVDVTVWDEHGGLPWSCSRLVQAQPLTGDSSVMSTGHFGFTRGREETVHQDNDDPLAQQGFRMSVCENGVGSVEIACAPMVQDFSCGTRQVMEPMLVVRDVQLVLQDSFIDSWFKTNYAAT